MKFATHLCVFNQDRWLKKHLEMIYSHVDYIYLSWSKNPWTYNTNARNEFKNNFNPNLIESKFSDKIKFIEGEWNNEEDQRNSCLNQARKDGIDILFIIDADEFYNSNNIKNIKSKIENNPNYDYYITPWITYWKNFDHVIVDSNNNMVAGYPEIALSVKSNTKFVRCRRPNKGKSMNLNITCHHASYVLTNQECWEKINTWGHSHQFDTKKWYNNIWLNWNNKKINLHPITPNAWKRAIKRPEYVVLPEILL